MQQNAIEQEQPENPNPQKYSSILQADLYIRKSLYARYSSSQSFFYSNKISQIVKQKYTTTSIQYYDKQTLLEEEEYLKRQYYLDEFNKKLAAFKQYYFYHQDCPRIYGDSNIADIYERWHEKKRDLIYKKLKFMYNESYSSVDSSQRTIEQQGKISQPVSHFLLDISEYNPYSKKYYLRVQARQQKQRLKQAQRNQKNQSKLLYNDINKQLSMMLNKITNDLSSITTLNGDQSAQEVLQQASQTKWQNIVKNINSKGYKNSHHTNGHGHNGSGSGLGYKNGRKISISLKNIQQQIRRQSHTNINTLLLNPLNQQNNGVKLNFKRKNIPNIPNIAQQISTSPNTKTNKKQIQNKINNNKKHQQLQHKTANKYPWHANHIQNNNNNNIQIIQTQSSKQSSMNHNMNNNLISNNNNNLTIINQQPPTHNIQGKNRSKYQHVNSIKQQVQVDKQMKVYNNNKIRTMRTMRTLDTMDSLKTQHISYNNNINTNNNTNTNSNSNTNIGGNMDNYDRQLQKLQLNQRQYIIHMLYKHMDMDNNHKNNNNKKYNNNNQYSSNNSNNSNKKIDRNINNIHPKLQYQS